MMFVAEFDEATGAANITLAQSMIPMYGIGGGYCCDSLSWGRCRILKKGGPPIEQIKM